MEVKIWGKSKSGETEISLSQHTNDVLVAFKHLSEKIELSPIYLRDLIEIVIKYHDAGKVLPYFQRKILGNTTYQPFDVYTNIPHSILSALLVNERILKEHLNALFKGNKQKVEVYSKFIHSAIAYHHWRENFYDIVEGFTDVFERLEHLVANEKKWNQIQENLNTVYSEIGIEKSKIPAINMEWLEGLTNGIQFSRYVIPPYLLYHLPRRIELEIKTEGFTLKDWVLISGFTMVCDHFASYVESDAEANISFEKIEIKGPSFLTIKERITQELNNKLKNKIDDSQIWQLQYIESYKNTNTILLAPTGMGKTEFSYLWSNGSKFFYTLPLRTATNQLFERTKIIFGKNNVGLLHSDADTYILGDGGESENMRIYELARQLSLSAIVSTGDQFFPYALRPPSYEKIFAKFSYSKLIIDEIQAYDPKAAAIVIKFIEHIVNMGGKFLLMTATIPSFIQKEIEKRIGEDFKKLNLFKEDNELANFSKHRIQLIVEKYKDGQLSYSEDLIQEILKKSEENSGSRILVVMNTIKQAQAVFEDLKSVAKENIEIRLFHSRFTQSHRIEIEEELAQFIGNNDESRKNRRPKILVATQVVEASLDLDADFLYTELAPWDSLIQRMGRILREAHPKNSNLTEIVRNRYKQKNDKKFFGNEPTLFDQIESEINIPENVFIIAYNGNNKKEEQIYESGQGHVYNEELLYASLKLFENISSIFERTISENGINEIKKWNNNKKKKALFEFDSPTVNNSYLLSELDKAYLVESLFLSLPEMSTYLKDFYNMLDILDAGFMSDRKSDAQKIFREISDVLVIAENQLDDFFYDLNCFDFKQKYAYTNFKNQILSKYIISVQRNKIRECLYDSNLITNRIKISDSITDNTKENFNRLKNWLSGIYVVALNYDDTKGLIGINELSNFL